MSNLNNNTTQLELLLTKVNALPEAGTGNEDLDSELTEQENLISQLSTILDSKASGSGSGSIDTCSVEISVEGGLSGYIYSYIANGEIISDYIAGVFDSITLNNVVCGTYITLSLITSQIVDSSNTVGATSIQNISFWYITANAGETAIITLMNV